VSPQDSPSIGVTATVPLADLRRWMDRADDRGDYVTARQIEAALWDDAGRQAADLLELPYPPLDGAA